LSADAIGKLLKVSDKMEAEGGKIGGLATKIAAP